MEAHVFQVMRLVWSLPLFLHGHDRPGPGEGADCHWQKRRPVCKMWPYLPVLGTTGSRARGRGQLPESANAADQQNSDASNAFGKTA